MYRKKYGKMTVSAWLNAEMEQTSLPMTIIGVILLLLANRKYSDKPYMLVLRCENENAETAAMALLDQSGCRSKVKAKTVTRDGMELSVEVKLKDASTNFVNALSAVEGMHSVSMVSYNGEYMS